LSVPVFGISDDQPKWRITNPALICIPFPEDSLKMWNSHIVSQTGKLNTIETGNAIILIPAIVVDCPFSIQLSKCLTSEGFRRQQNICLSSSEKLGMD
jgi:hypothetical protein